jgi:hypothetical protein
MKNHIKKPPLILSLLVFLASPALIYAQVNGNNKNKGKHIGQIKHHPNHGLHRGTIKHALRSVSPRANPKATMAKLKKY